MMKTMVKMMIKPMDLEKIARALCQSDGAAPDRPGTTFRSEQPKSAWQLYVENAQAALTAMLEGFGGDGVTEGDRSAAVDALSTVEEYDHGCDCDDCNDLRTHSLPALVQAFARHRQLSAAAERARIVAWLRKEADALAIEQANTRQGSPDWLCLREQVEDHQLIADAIEHGEV